MGESSVTSRMEGTWAESKTTGGGVTVQRPQSTQSNGVLDRDGKSQKEYGRVVSKCDFGGMAEVAKDDDVGLVEVKKAGRKKH